MADKTGRIPLNLAISIAQQLLKTDLVLPHELDDTALTQSGKIDKLHLFANIGPEFTQETSVLPEVQLTSLYTDPFNYAGRGESLLYRIDVLLHTSLDEWYTLQFNGLTAPLDLLQHLIAWWNNSPDAHPIECWCPSETHGQIISKRLQQLTKDVSQYYRKHKQAKYITQLADELYQLSWQPEGVDVLSLNTNDQAEAFQNINDHYIAVFLDSQNDRRGLNRTIYKTHKSETVSLLIEPETDGTAIHAIDEFGNLHTQRHLKLHTGTAIKLYQQFLSAVRKQKPDLHVEFHQLVKPATGIWQTKPLKITQQETKREYLPVIVELKSPALDTECTITCGPTVFTGRANDINLFADLSIFIYGLRNNRIEYPLYINELLFSDPSKANTGHYFIHKKHFEEQLNHQ